MAEQWSLMFVVQTLFIMATVTTVAVARHRGTSPMVTERTLRKSLQFAAPTVWCASRAPSKQHPPRPRAGVQRDHSISTINYLQRDFFLESALVVGGMMTLDANLRDDAPKRALLTASSDSQLPALISSNALAPWRS